MASETLTNTVDAADKQYFMGYEDLRVHRLMLEDEVRTKSYHDAIFNNKSIFEGKTVMDVGCGTGILSIFCAQAGAKKVHAVEASSVAQLAKKVIEDNKLQSVIEVHEKRVEDLVLEEQVDVIVSEWMGMYLLHEGMIESVLFARDRFLKCEGVLFPSKAKLWVAPAELPKYCAFWNNVFGVKMTSIGDFERSSRSNPEICQVEHEDLLTKPFPVKTIDMKSVSSSELRNINCDVIVPAYREGQFDGICFWFDCEFPSAVGNKPVVMSTAPWEGLTHWQQTAIILPKSSSVEDGEPIAFTINMTQDSTNGRHYSIQIEMKDPEKVTHPHPCDCYLTKCIVIKAFLNQQSDDEKNGLIDEIDDE